MGSTQMNTTTDTEQLEHIFIITGPAGCGKTTVAQHLAKSLGFPYVEGDDVRILLVTFVTAFWLTEDSFTQQQTKRRWATVFH